MDPQEGCLCGTRVCRAPIAGPRGRLEVQGQGSRTNRREKAPARPRGPFFSPPPAQGGLCARDRQKKRDQRPHGQRHSWEARRGEAADSGAARARAGGPWAGCPARGPPGAPWPWGRRRRRRQPRPWCRWWLRWQLLPSWAAEARREVGRYGRHTHTCTHAFTYTYAHARVCVCCVCDSSCVAISASVVLLTLSMYDICARQV